MSVPRSPNVLMSPFGLLGEAAAAAAAAPLPVTPTELPPGMQGEAQQFDVASLQPFVDISTPIARSLQLSIDAEAQRAEEDQRAEKVQRAA